MLAAAGLRRHGTCVHAVRGRRLSPGSASASPPAGRLVVMTSGSFSPAPGLLARTFRSLRVYNFRLFFFSQVISMSGTWMQSVAQNWLVLSLTDSAVALGVTVGFQFGPVLLFGAWGGTLADRVDKRRLLMGTQTAAAVL
ncbi:MAG: MFS transporter, partial [Actinobacteria bacterium]|nr:MFS transporter [Actinomycetota bacterium]